MDTTSNLGWFGLPPGTSPSRLLQSLRRAGYVAGPPVNSRFECLFVETQDGRLAKGGCRLSIRWTGGSAAWHLSGPAGETEGPFEGDASFRNLSPDMTGAPPAVRELATGRPLLPLVRLRMRAWDAVLQSPSGGTLALLAERFSAAPPRGCWPKGAWADRLLTVRLTEGNPDTFLHLITYLRDRLNLPARSGDACSAALRALGLPEPGAPVPTHLRILPGDALALAARKVVGQQALRMRSNIQGALEDLDLEYLHDLRVATRRLRSALRLFADVLGPRRCDSLREELNWIGQFLGAVRDLDVFIPTLRAQAQRLGGAGVIASLLAEELGQQRLPARAALRTALASRRFLSLMHRLDALASSPPPRRPRGAQAVPVSSAAPALLWKAQKRLLRLGRTIDPNSPAADLHRLRILFKRLRYASEFFREALADPTSGEDPLADYIEALVRFQDCLGEHQDAMVAIAWIQALAKDMVRRGGTAPERLLDLGSVIQVQREIAHERRGRLAKLWARFDSGSVRKRLRTLRTEVPLAPETGENSKSAPP